MNGIRPAVAARLIIALSLVAAAAGGRAEDVGGLPFVRVNVPREALPEVPLTDGRYVPMPLAAFEDAVARLGPAGQRVRQGGAVEARYELAVEPAGDLAGTVEFRLGETAAWPDGQVTLGRLTAGRCTVRTADGTGEAPVFCLADGSAAVRTTGPGTYSCEIRLPRSGVVPIVRLPLVPALVTTVELRLPDGARPLVTGADAAVTLVEAPPSDGDRWRIVRGPVGHGGDLALVIQDQRRGPPPVRAWNGVTVSGRQAQIVTRLEPAAWWTADTLELVAAPGIRVTSVITAPEDPPVRYRIAKQRLTIDVPARLAGSTRPILVSWVVPTPTAELAALPVLQPVAARWGGCNTRLSVDPSLAVRQVRLDDCRVLPPNLAEQWPVPVVEPGPANAGIEPALVFLEHESPAAEARVAIGPREASLDTARLTVVDISPGTVLARAAVDIRVVAGQMFGLTADVAPGWFIDSVEAVDWTAGRQGAEATPLAGPPPEWRVTRSPRGSELRIGLPSAATPRRSLGLRITGHRAGLPLGAEFSSDDIDMVRFPGETAVLEFQLGPTAVLEAAGGGLGLEPLPERLATLAGPTTPRARIRAGERAPATRARLVRRRPPVEADVAVDLLARDDRLAETFTFTCRPVSGELDAVVVHFSEPMGPGLEWTLAAADGGSLSAQPLDPGDSTRGELRSEAAVAESWLVELRPATTEAVTFLAGRTVPLENAVTVPLAWVEAAERPGGIVTLRGEPGRRPTVVNHQLRELPPAADGDPGVVTLAYGPPRSLVAGTAAAEVSGAPAAARAWAWRQSTTCWCFESGGLEWEAVFDIENHGRESATITLPEGLRVEGITVGGETLAATAIGPDLLGLSVPLPRESGRVQLVVRGSGSRSGRLGWWRVGDVTCRIDMPVLDPTTTLMLPPGLVLATPALVTDQPDWISRLFAATVFPSAAGTGVRQGFQAVPLPDGGGGGTTPVVIRRRLVVSLAVLAGCGAALATLWLARWSGPAAIAACGAAAGAALWCASPWDTPARAALWGAIVGTWAAGWRSPPGRRTAASVVTIWLFAITGTATAADPVPLRVYVTPDDDGGTALVPEQLFRRLSAAAAAAGPPSVRVLETGIRVDADGGVWRVGLTLDTDRGGQLVLDQGMTAAAWRLPARAPAGLAVSLAGEGRVATISATAGGRCSLDLELVPAVRQLGDLLVADVALPPAPQARLRLGEGAAGIWECDAARGTGPWLPIVAAEGAFDISAAARVRLVRPADPRATCPPVVRAAVSFNDLAWDGDGCRLTAAFDVGAERQIVRSLTLRTDATLEPVAPANPAAIPRPLGDGRYVIEIPEPRAGQRRVVVEFRRPLADPVGIFDVPWAWLTDVETDVRTVRLRPAGDLEVAPELPAGISLVRPRDEDAVTATAMWRSDALSPATDAAAAESRPRVVVRRRDRPPSVAQDLAVEFADDHVGLRLRCRIDAAVEPLLEVPVTVPPAAIIDGIVLTREPTGEEEGAARRIDLNWSREAADRIVAVVQRPETGRFRMQVDARLPIRPARRGQLPIARIATDDLPLEVTCRAAAGMGVRLESSAAGGAVAVERIELGPVEPAPAYLLARDPPPPDASDATASPAGEGAPGGPASVSTTVDLAIDGQGRAWGIARFDLITAEPVVRLVLPPGLRLFDVRIDGRDAMATPIDAATWELRLHDATWPRSLVAVIAGTLGGRLADGEAIRLEPPRLADLPPGPVLWSLATPAGFSVRVSAPARVLDPESFAAARAERLDILDQAFRRAVRGTPLGPREQLDAFAASRRAGGEPAGERVWYEAWRGPTAADPERTLVAPGDDGSVTFRAVSAAGSPVPARGLVTTVILAAVIACWRIARRFPEAATWVAGIVRRWWWLACGIVWLVAIGPVLPGLLMLAVGAWIATAPWRMSGPGAADDERPLGGSDSTLTFAPE
ncbi:MAG: hypothetical protein ACKOCX_10275 [Planctomycetota bacterium]